MGTQMSGPWGYINWMGFLLLVSLSETVFAQPLEPDMVRIPGGVFTMGSTKGLADERPPHKQAVSTFWIDKRPVTNAEFASFLTKIGNNFSTRGQRLFDIDDDDAEVLKSGNVYQPHKGKLAQSKMVFLLVYQHLRYVA